MYDTIVPAHPCRLIDVFAGQQYDFPHEGIIDPAHTLLPSLYLFLAFHCAGEFHLLDILGELVNIGGDLHSTQSIV